MLITALPFLLVYLTCTVAHKESSRAYMIVEKAGKRYYDLALANRSELVLGGEDDAAADKVWGVTVEGGKCDVEALLVLNAAPVLDDVVAEKCSSLHNITMVGNLICGRIINWIEKFGGKVDIQGVSCIDVMCHIPVNSSYGYTTKSCELSSIKDYSPFKERVCPEMCQECKSIIDLNGVWTKSVIVTCQNARLTEFNLPTLHFDTDSLFLPGNKIRSATKLLDKLKYLAHLRLLDLDNNLVTSIPYLPTHTHTSLTKIFLSNNNITELDVEATEALFKRDLELILDGNQLVCGCHLYFANKLYMKYCSGPTPCITNYRKYRCFSESENRTLPMWEMTNLEGCDPVPFIFDYWILLIVVLILLNAVMFWLIGDMIYISWRCKGVREPKMDCLVKFMGSQLRRLCPRETPDDQDIADVIDQSNYARSAMLRSRRPW